MGYYALQWNKNRAQKNASGSGPYPASCLSLLSPMFNYYISINTATEVVLLLKWAMSLIMSRVIECRAETRQGWLMKPRGGHGWKEGAVMWQSKNITFMLYCLFDKTFYCDKSLPPLWLCRRKNFRLSFRNLPAVYNANNEGSAVFIWKGTDKNKRLFQRTTPISILEKVHLVSKRNLNGVTKTDFHHQWRQALTLCSRI